jgi:hypothetical protein
MTRNAAQEPRSVEHDHRAWKYATGNQHALKERLLVRIVALCDWRGTRAPLAGTEARMVTILDDLGLTALVTTIGGADPSRRRRDPRRDRRPGPVRHRAGAGQARRAVPTRKRLRRPSGQRPPSPGRGRPALRLAVWRAVWAAMPNNPVMAARLTYLTTHQHNLLARQLARTACAATLLRWIHVVITQHATWDPAIAAGTTTLAQGPAGTLAGWPQLTAATQDPGGTSPNVPCRTHLVHEHEVDAGSGLA